MRGGWLSGRCVVLGGTVVSLAAGGCAQPVAPARVPSDGQIRVVPGPIYTRQIVPATPPPPVSPEVQHVGTETDSMAPDEAPPTLGVAQREDATDPASAAASPPLIEMRDLEPEPVAPQVGTGVSGTVRSTEPSADVLVDLPADSSADPVDAPDALLLPEAPRSPSVVFRPPPVNPVPPAAAQAGPSPVTEPSAVEPPRHTPPTLAPPESQPPEPQPPESQPLTLAPVVDDVPLRPISEPPGGDVLGHLEGQLIRFVDGEPVPQPERLGSLPPEDRRVVTTLLNGLENFRARVRQNPDDAAADRVRPLVEMGETLRSEAALSIPAVVLCTRVEGFGRYEPISPEGQPTRLRAGEEHAAVLYCEVDGFTSRINDRDRWEARLTWDAVLYSEGGLKVWGGQSSEVVDESRNRRRDFFVARVIRLPATLPVGRYTLKVTIIDPASDRVAEASTSILIVAG